MYKDNAKQKPNNIFPIFGSVKIGARKPITENQKITDCHEIFDGRATIRRNQRSGGVWQFNWWLRAENKQYRLCALLCCCAVVLLSYCPIELLMINLIMI